MDKNDKDYASKSNSIQNDNSIAKEQLQNIVGPDTDVNDFVSNFVDKSYSNLAPNNVNGNGNSLRKMSPSQFSSLDSGKQKEAKDWVEHCRRSERIGQFGQEF
jgi:hypothetical protein